jgi:hypothetical protein
MMGKTWKDWIGETRVQRRSLLQNRDGVRQVWVDNYGAHYVDGEYAPLLNKAKMRIRKLPACATDKCQPADSFVISKIKEVWTEA